MKNVGGIDKIVRIAAGVILILLAITGVFSPWGWIGVLPLLTGLLGWCPAYRLFGIKTCPMSKK